MLSNFGLGAHSQGETLDEVNHNRHEVIEMLLEDGDPVLESKFVGVQNVAIAWVMGNVPVLKPNDVVAILIEGSGARQATTQAEA